MFVRSLQIIMGTVVLSVVGNSLVAWAEEYFPGRRRVLVATMYAVIIAALVGIGIIYIPRLTQEGAKVIARIQVMVCPSLRSCSFVIQQHEKRKNCRFFYKVSGS